MASPLQTLIATMAMLSLVIGCAEKVSGMRYIPNFFTTGETKHSEFLVSIAPQPSGLIPRLGRFLLPPQPKRPFHPYNDPIAAAPASSCGIPSSFAPHPGYGAPVQALEKMKFHQCHNHLNSSTNKHLLDAQGSTILVSSDSFFWFTQQVY